MPRLKSFSNAKGTVSSVLSLSLSLSCVFCASLLSHFLREKDHIVFRVSIYTSKTLNMSFSSLAKMDEKAAQRSAHRVYRKNTLLKNATMKVRLCIKKRTTTTCVLCNALSFFT